MKPIGILFLFLNSSQILFADFSLICPPDITVSCRTDYLHDLNMFGKAYTDYNGVITYVHDCKTIIELDDCGKGTIKRVWGVENLENWQWLTCMQVITISNTDGFTYADITWPQSLTIRSCDPNTDLKNLQPPYDMPVWERPKCSKPMLSYTDTRFKVDDGCEKIIRLWKVLDWCQYDPVLFPGRGLFTYTQVIKLLSTSDGIRLQCQSDTVVLNSKNCDTLYVKLDSAVFSSNCKIYHKIHNTSKFAVHDGANASGYYPNGITKFYYIAEYACGTEVKCEVTIDVRNKLQPTPYCLTGVTLTLMPVDNNNDGVIDDGMIEVWASDLDKGSWHKCPAQKLQFSFSKDKNDQNRIYTCKDVGENEVEIWITDSLGNQDVCKTIITIQNNYPNIPNCDGGLRGGTNSIDGKVKFLSAVVPPKLRLSLQSVNGQRDYVTDKTNQFEFQFQNVRSKQSYLLQTSCTYADLKEIDFDDLSFLKKMIDGKVKPRSPYIWFAADINQDHVVDQLDFHLLKHIIQFKKINLLTKTWIFIPENFLFTNPTDPFRDIMPSGIEINYLDHDMQDQNFMAIRIGDIISSAGKESDLEDRMLLVQQSADFIVSYKTIDHSFTGVSLVQFDIESGLSQYLQLDIFTLDGKIIRNQKVKVNQGHNTFQLELETKGLIFYHFRNELKNQSGKIVLHN